MSAINMTTPQLIAMMRVKHPNWKIRQCPTNGKITATCKTFKGHLRVKSGNILAVIRAIVKHERGPVVIKDKPKEEAQA